MPILGLGLMVAFPIALFICAVFTPEKIAAGAVAAADVQAAPTTAQAIGRPSMFRLMLADLAADPGPRHDRAALCLLFPRRQGLHHPGRQLPADLLRRRGHRRRAVLGRAWRPAVRQAPHGADRLRRLLDHPVDPDGDPARAGPATTGPTTCRPSLGMMAVGFTASAFLLAGARDGGRRRRRGAAGAGPGPDQPALFDGHHDHQDRRQHHGGDRVPGAGLRRLQRRRGGGEHARTPSSAWRCATCSRRSSWSGSAGRCSSATSSTPSATPRSARRCRRARRWPRREESLTGPLAEAPAPAE